MLAERPMLLQPMLAESAVVQLIEGCHFSGCVLFWHTGGHSASLWSTWVSTFPGTNTDNHFTKYLLIVWTKLTLVIGVADRTLDKPRIATLMLNELVLRAARSKQPLVRTNWCWLLLAHTFPTAAMRLNCSTPRALTAIDATDAHIVIVTEVHIWCRYGRWQAV